MCCQGRRGGCRGVPARLARGHFDGHLAGMRRPPLRMCNPESRLLQSGSRVSGHRLDTATVAQRPRPWRVREAASAQASVARLNPSRGVRPSRPVSGMQPGFSSHVWGASGGLRLGLCSLVPAARVCLTLRMRGTGRGERWECDPQMDAPLRAPPSPEGHRATGIFQNELPWQVPRAPPLRVPHARTVPGEPPPAPSGRLRLGLARPLLSDRLGWVSQGPLPASPRGCHLGRGICTYLTVLCT